MTSLALLRVSIRLGATEYITSERFKCLLVGDIDADYKELKNLHNKGALI